jgi:DNA-binding PadR family transcriptional regulator
MARKTSRTLYAILGMLSKQDASGYDLKKKLEKERYHFWNESYGQIYPMLHRLLEEGWAEVETTESEAGREKKIYSLTDAGRNHLQRWLRQPAQDFSMRDEVVLRLDMAADANTALTQGMLERELDACKARLKALQEDDEVEDLGDFEQMSAAWSEAYLSARISWLEDSIGKCSELTS